jgi:hypothetical protein
VTTQHVLGTRKVATFEDFVPASERSPTPLYLDSKLVPGLTNDGLTIAVSLGGDDRIVGDEIWGIGFWRCSMELQFS